MRGVESTLGECTRLQEVHWYKPSRRIEKKNRKTDKSEHLVILKQISYLNDKLQIVFDASYIDDSNVRTRNTNLCTRAVTLG